MANRAPKKAVAKNQPALITTVNEAVGAVATELTKFFHMSQRPVPEDPSRYNGGIGHQTDYGV